MLYEKVVEEIERFIEAYYECTYFDEDLLMLRAFLRIYGKGGDLTTLVRKIKKMEGNE